MVRNKHVARRTSNKSSSYGKGRSYSSFCPFDGTSSQASRQFKNVNLHEEDLGDNNKKSYSNLSNRLRHSRITFVSAGNLESDFPKDEASTSNDTRSRPVVLPLTEKNQTFQNSAPKLDKGPRNEASFEKAGSDGFIIDLHGSAPIETGLSPPTIRPRSPASSDSSEEIILFKGRKSVVDDLTGRGINFGCDNTDDTIDVASKNVPELNLEKSNHTNLNVPDQNALSKSIKSNFYESKSSQLINIAQSSLTEKSKKQFEDEIISDYLANIESEDTNALLSFTRRDLGGSVISNYSSLDIESLKESLNETIDGKLTTELQDVHVHEDASFSHNCGDLIQKEAKNKIGSGTTDIATNKSETSSTSGILRLNMYDTLVDLTEYYDDEITKSDCGSFSDLDYGNFSVSDFSPENTKMKRDSNLEKVFARYEELEMGSESTSRLNNLELISYSKKKSGTILQKKNKKRDKKSNQKITKGKENNMTGGGKNLHAYDDIFDVIGFDSPRNNRGKDRKTNLSSAKQRLNFEDYIEMQLQKDLLKKSKRRKAREKSRSLGLLGSKNGNSRVLISYNDGISISDLKREFKTFLQSDRDTLVLPPMAKIERKIVHEIANKFKLKSNSRGNGTKRFATLYRTSHTIQYTDDIFNSLEARLVRRFFPAISPRMKSASSKKKPRSSGASKIAVSYQEGDIVGGSAPEISADNIGRAMLEKMGWSTGTALGALNNKGILQPVLHVVKISKAGLG
ncbi:hypothetical protein GcM3_072010 [Golovinomyces cichoracearum]|uniref:Protein SQS1 n=1 Tax=Golovinomyces cichoracearum TaxID=62708 RepID=A0A420ISB1_9PEZI|nr:hypothetical protein GcM3_072010 [Golovinomyces cichoracearum]